jgi:hypothetical protein
LKYEGWQATFFSKMYKDFFEIWKFETSAVIIQSAQCKRALNLGSLAVGTYD